MRTIRASRSTCDIPLWRVVPNELRGSRFLLSRGEPKPFKLNINLMWLWEANDGTKRSHERDRWYARVSIVDYISPIQIDNENGFYSIIMPCHCDKGFVTKAEPTDQAT
jgi:hypothetical protein